MAATYDDYDYEPEVPKKKKEKKEKKREKQKGGWGSRILCLILGFIIGAASLPATVAGIVFLVMSQPVAKTVETIDKVANTDLYETLFGSTNDAGEVTAGIFNEKYADLKIVDLVTDVTESLGELGDEGSNLAELNEVSPIVGQTLDNLLKSLRDLSIPIDSDELMERPFKGEDHIGDYLLDSIMNASAGDLLRGIMGSEMNGLLMTLCYGEEGVDYEIVGDSVSMLGSAEKVTLNDLFGDDLSNVLDKIPVDTFISPEPDDTVMCAIAYGPSNRYEVSGDTVTMAQVAYTQQNGDFYNDSDELLSYKATQLSGGVYQLLIDTGETNGDGTHKTETQYVRQGENSNEWLAYSDEACRSPIRYKKKTIGDLDQDAMSIIDSIQLADALELTPSSHPILLSLAYGTEGVDYTIESGMITCEDPHTIGDLRSRNEDLINAISLSDIMYASPDDVLSMYIVYGREGVHYELVDGKAVMQQRYVAVSGTNVYNEYGEVLDGTVNANTSVYTENGVEYSLTNGSRTIETKDGKNATVYYLSDNGVAVLFPRTSLGDLSGSDNLITNLTGRLRLGELLDENSIAENRIFSLLTDVVIDELPTAVSRLKITEIYEDEIYENGNLKGEWKYLLTDENGSVGDYTIDNMGDMMNNMKRNIETATLGELHTDGFLNMSNENALKHDVVSGVSLNGEYYVFTVPAGKENTTLSKLTVTEAMDYIGSIFEAIDDAGIAVE